MEFKVLSHACLLVKSGSNSIIFDPWLVGSSYWRSWWNFPKANFSEEEVRAVDAVFISHVHWDHWHGPTLRRFFKGKTVIIPKEPVRRSYDDLVRMGFKSIVELGHAVHYDVGSIRITPYLFGVHLHDAAVVVEDEKTTLLNANDAKLAGPPLSHLLSRHKKIDFAFRSHSSANPRNCFRVADNPGFTIDDRDHYFRSFCLFMNRVNPVYAVPFASNHCHLLDDVQHFNSLISNPIELRRYVHNGRQQAWRLQVMLPGSSWSRERGFELASEADFDDLAKSLREYRQLNQEILTRYEKLEEETVISPAILRRFLSMFSGDYRRWKSRDRFLLTLHWPSKRQKSYLIGARNASVLGEPTEHAPTAGVPQIRMPAVIFRDAVYKNMFHHASISKRCEYVVKDEKDLPLLHRVVGFLDLCELRVMPLDLKQICRVALSYLPRWRELLVYARAFWEIHVKKTPSYIVEERILRSGTR